VNEKTPFNQLYWYSHQAKNAVKHKFYSVLAFFASRLAEKEVGYYMFNSIIQI